MSNFLDYYAAGGRRRFALCYHNGNVYLWNSGDLYKEILGVEGCWTTTRRWEEPNEQYPDLALWLRENGLEGKD